MAGQIGKAEFYEMFNFIENDRDRKQIKRDFKEISKRLDTNSVNGSTFSMLASMENSNNNIDASRISQAELAGAPQPMAMQENQRQPVTLASLQPSQNSEQRGGLPIQERLDASPLNGDSMHQSDAVEGKKVKFRHLLDYYFIEGAGRSFAQCIRQFDARSVYSLLLAGYNSDTEDENQSSK